MADPLAQFYGTGAPTPTPADTEGGSGGFYGDYGGWLSLGLGGAAAIGGAMLLKKPFLKDAVSSGLKRVMEKLPKEYPLLKAIPDSPVVSLTEKHATDYARALEGVVTGPLKGVLENRLKPQEWIDLESKMYGAYKALGETPAARRAAYELLPPRAKTAITFLEDEMRPAEQTAAKYLGERVLEDIPHPYIPRIAQHNFTNEVKIGGFTPGLRSDIRATLGSFEEKRAFPTMKQGILAGEEYADPSVALLYRAHAGLKLKHTADYIKSLEDAGVLFRDEAAAKAASTTGDAVKLLGVPGTQPWYVRSKLEAQFLKDQLENPGTTGGLTALTHQANKIFRNPNLMNPLPHFTKNMLFKYGWSGGSLPRVFDDAREYATRSNPELIKRFQAVMPFANTGKTATDILLDAKALAEGSTIGRFRKVLEKPNEWSSQLVFGKFDPWLRYARWKQYVEKGMPDQEAANHVWIDLIRYGTRSDLVDFWKSIPFNFFVPWRIGTITSLVKNAQSEPLRAAMFLGSVDLMKEIIYRQTGWWFHTPSDYIEGPVARLLESSADRPHKGAAALGSIAGTTALFGPGGTGADRMINNVLGVIDKGSVDYKQLVNMFWGLAAIADPYGSFQKEVAGFATDGKPEHLVKVLQSVAFGAHNALDYRPKRLGQFLPEIGPLVKSEKVKQAETLQDRSNFRKENRRPYRSISERLGD